MIDLLDDRIRKHVSLVMTNSTMIFRVTIAWATNERSTFLFFLGISRPRSNEIQSGVKI